MDWAVPIADPGYRDKNASAYEFLQESSLQDWVNRLMEAILKVISCLVGFYMIANGVWVIRMPPTGDEPLGYLIIAIGLFIPLLTLFMAHVHARSYD